MTGTDSAQAKMAFKFWQVTQCSILDAADTFGVEPDDLMAVYKRVRPLQFWFMVVKVSLIIRLSLALAAVRHIKRRLLP